MVLGFIKVGAQGGGGQERREPYREHRRKTVRKPAHAKSYAEDYTPSDYPRTYDNAPVRPHYEVIAPKPPRGRDRKESIVPGGWREYPKAYDNEPIRPHYQVIAPKPPLYDNEPVRPHYQVIAPKPPPREVPTTPRGRRKDPRIYDNAPVSAHYQFTLPKPSSVRERVASVAPKGRREQPKHHHTHKAASYQQNHGRGHEIARGKSPPRRPKHRQEPNKGIASYREIKVLGEGGQGQCHLVERRSDGRKFVRKVSHTFMKKSNGKPVEAYILQDVLSQHERSIKLIEYTIAQDSLIAIYELYPGGDLTSYLPNKYIERPSERFVWWIFVQLADILAYLHEGFDHKNPHRAPREWKPVIHCDIKPDNVFLREHPRDTAYPNVVLGDFGFATLKSGKYCSGTKSYHSPEIKETGNTTCSDVWALGATIHELVHGYAPEGGIPDPLPGSFSSNLDSVVSECLASDPYYRISARQLVQRVYKEYGRWR